MKVYIIDENDFQTVGEVIDSAYSGYDTPVITKETIMSKAINFDTPFLYIPKVELPDKTLEKTKVEIEPDMDRCHFIKSEHFIDTEEYVDWYIYNNVKIKVIKTYLPWRYEVIYDSKPYVYLSLDGACKFIENNITLH